MPPRRSPTPPGDYNGATLFLDAVREVAGEDGLSAILKLRAGREIGLPSYAKPDHWLSRILGFECAKKVCDRVRVTDPDGRAIGGFRCYLPSGSGALAVLLAERKADAEKLLLDRQKVGDVCSATGLGDRTIKRIRRDLVERQRLRPLTAARKGAGA